MTPPNEPREPVPVEAREVADALKAIAKPHPTVLVLACSGSA